MRKPPPLYLTTATAVALSFILGIVFLLRTGLPSADVVAREAAQRPIINVSDFSPGDVEIVVLNDLPVIIWRRSEADKTLAASQNTPEDWRYQNSKVFGRTDPVFADDTNLTLDHKWFFALATFPNRYQYLLLRTGDFDGFLEGRYATHFDLAGRVRSGVGEANLTIVSARYIDDGERIQLLLGDMP